MKENLELDSKEELDEEDIEALREELEQELEENGVEIVQGEEKDIGLTLVEAVTKGMNAEEKEKLKEVD